MKTAYKLLFVLLLAGGLVFARSGQNNSKIEGKKVNSEHYWVKDQSKNSDNKLDRKRSHKRRRKIRKPIKGLR